MTDLIFWQGLAAMFFVTTLAGMVTVAMQADALRRMKQRCDDWMERADAAEVLWREAMA